MAIEDRGDDTDDDNEDEIDDSEVDKWPGRVEAAKILGVSRNTLVNMIKRGDLTPVKDSKNRDKFDPEQLEEAGGQEGTANKILLTTLTKSVKQSNDHARSFFQMVNDPAKQLLGMMQEENKRLRERISNLEDKQLEFFESYQVLLSESNTREIAKKESEAKLQRQTQAMGLFYQMAPLLFKQLMASSEVKKLVQTMGQAELEGLKEHGLITESQYDAIAELRKGVDIHVVNDESRLSEVGSETAAKQS